jgi:hypothetical protein
MMIKANEATEAGVMPSESDVAAMMKYNEALVNAGALLAGEGLHSSSRGARVKFHRGKPTVTDGPFAEAKDLIAGYWIIQAKSKADALDWAQRIPFEEGGVDAEVEVRPLYELEDFPVGEDESGWREQEEAYREMGPTVNPVDPRKKQFVVFRMADAETEAESSPADLDELYAAMSAYNEDMIKAGVMLTGEGLKPTSEGFRVKYTNGKRSVVDGPFTEAKELVAGFTHMQVDSKEEAIEWLKRWPVQDANGEVELQLRQVIGAEDFDISPELRAEEDRLRERAQSKR